MKLIKPPRAVTGVIGSVDINVIQAAYSLAKVNSEQAAKEVLHDTPHLSLSRTSKAHARTAESIFARGIWCGNSSH